VLTAQVQVVERVEGRQTLHEYAADIAVGFDAFVGGAAAAES
jgi:hypothetical protein